MKLHHHNIYIYINVVHLGIPLNVLVVSIVPAITSEVSLFSIGYAVAYLINISLHVTVGRCRIGAVLQKTCLRKTCYINPFEKYAYCDEPTNEFHLVCFLFNSMFCLKNPGPEKMCW